MALIARSGLPEPVGIPPDAGGCCQDGVMHDEGGHSWREAAAIIAGGPATSAEAG